MGSSCSDGSDGSPKKVLRWLRWIAPRKWRLSHQPPHYTPTLNSNSQHFSFSVAKLSTFAAHSKFKFQNLSLPYLRQAPSASSIQEIVCCNKMRVCSSQRWGECVKNVHQKGPPEDCREKLVVYTFLPVIECIFFVVESDQDNS